MLTTESTPVLIAHRTNAEISGRATIEVIHLTMQKRILRACIHLLVCWLTALIFVLIPVLHFFLVPLATLAGIAVFFYQLRLKEYRPHTVLDCPACHTGLNLKSGAFNWPIRETCDSCRASLSIDQDAR